MRKVQRTGGAPFDSTPATNIASHAQITASNAPVPVQYRLRALNDGHVRRAPLPPDMWATWSPQNPPQQWALYQWETPVSTRCLRAVFTASTDGTTFAAVAEQERQVEALEKRVARREPMRGLASASCAG